LSPLENLGEIASAHEAFAPFARIGIGVDKLAPVAFREDRARFGNGCGFRHRQTHDRFGEVGYDSENAIGRCLVNVAFALLVLHSNPIG